MANNREKEFAIYKGKGGRNGAAQFKLIPFQRGRTRKDGKENDAGFILVEGAATTAPDIYDWDNKISFAMDVGDIGQFLVGLGGGHCDIYHKYNNAVKKLAIKLGNNDKDGNPTWMLSLTTKADGEQSWHTINLPVSCNEAAVLKELMRSAIPIIRGWDSNPLPYDLKGSSEE